MLYNYPSNISRMDAFDCERQSDVAREFSLALSWLSWVISKLPNKVLTKAEVKKISKDTYHDSCVLVNISCDKETGNRFFRLTFDGKTYCRRNYLRLGYLAYDMICVGRDKVFFDNSNITDVNGLLDEIKTAQSELRKDEEYWHAKYIFKAKAEKEARSK